MFSNTFSVRFSKWFFSFESEKASSVNNSCQKWLWNRFGICAEIVLNTFRKNCLYSFKIIFCKCSETDFSISQLEYSFTRIFEKLVQSQTCFVNASKWFRNRSVKMVSKPFSVRLSKWIWNRNGFPLWIRNVFSDALKPA